jgi:hypothetical protein
MATVVNFNGKRIIEPGVYAQIKSGIPARPNNFSFGNLLVIDTGKGSKFGGGSGINGQFSNGLNSIYSFDDVDDFKGFVKGGLFYDLADYIFTPANNAAGPQTVYIARAAQTVPAEIMYEFLSSPNGGKLSFLCKNEGSIGNGVTDEIPGKTVIRVDVSSVSSGQVFELEVQGESIGSVTLTSNSIIEAVVSLSNEINSGNSGYTSKVEGNTLLLFSKPNVGNPELFSVVATADVQILPFTTNTFTGWVAGTKLSKGYGAQMKKSDNDSTKYIIQIFEGTFAGLTENGRSINGLTPTQSNPKLITTSVEFDNIDTLIQWCRNDFIFNKLFELKDDYQIIGDGSLIEADFLANIELNLASGGSETYNPADLDRLLEDIRELDNTFILSDRWGDEARGVENNKILQYIKNVSEFNKFLVIGGGSDETKFDTGDNSSIEIAKYFDTTSVIVVHDGEKRYNPFDGSKEKLPSIYHAANVAGRLGGLEPQESGTFKTLRIKEFNHPLGLKQREKALQYGVIHSRNVPGIGNVINQAVNTLQNNTRLINPDGTSFEISIMRIGAQLNKELTLNMRPLFIGSNWGKSSPADVKAFVEGYLLNKTSTSARDSLIISFKNVTVRLIEDYYDIKYGFVPNGPINKMFITGFMLDANLNA